MPSDDGGKQVKVGTRDFRNDLKTWLHRAEEEPVTITVAGYDRHVIVGVELWRKLTRNGKRASAA